MVVALACSFLVAWLGLPVIYLLLSRKAVGSKPLAGSSPSDEASGSQEEKATSQPPAATSSETVHHDIPWLRSVIRHPAYSIVGIVGLVATLWVIIPRLATGFLPEMDEGAIVLDYNSPPGTSIEETDRLLRQAEKLIVQVPEVASYSRRTGTQMGFFITEPNRGDYLIRLKTSRQRTTNEVIDDIRQRIEATQPALTIDFGQVIGDMLGNLMSTVQPIQIKVFGPDAATRYQFADQVAAVVSQVPGTADVFNGIVRMGPSVDVRPDPPKLAPAQAGGQGKRHGEAIGEADDDVLEDGRAGQVLLGVQRIGYEKKKQLGNEGGAGRRGRGPPVPDGPLHLPPPPPAVRAGTGTVEVGRYRPGPQLLHVHPELPHVLVQLVAQVL